ncbi:type 2 isopentenyl-diphosphate Delta-isomerase [Aeromicrobium sp. YIM 150415]|uniref:type 2 isopentenyl-diphosphate Delta-isomerase n=1 Tax=Aeromicrobium sp. YIM 150415 TaxID=2803912 RepID=UPI001964C17C|nr:type 2 isopentenyl-diphosphate Delta-isomerase [Aeromicrobium sp. YIM 150415]MBM9464508.1 type 2 isopentenyl-diphosphate Delta-isomerase [Aeromicrobium sp. YIM 150415]
MSRKAEHMDLALHAEVERISGPGWDELDLVHEALPELDVAEVDLSVDLFGRRLRAPLVIAAMTGGHAGAVEVNATLARAAERHGLAMGVGSQRAALADPSLVDSYAIVRECAPTAPVIGNIGAAQLIGQGEAPALSIDDLRRAVDMVGADALAIHLNFLEESVQPEGDAHTKGCAEAIGAVASALEVPIVVKETGAGMSRRTAERLRDLGVAALDVGGAGGTSFAIVERLRARQQGDHASYALGMALGEWGIPTAATVAATAPVGLPVIATGGVRGGLDAAKAIALGATAAGVARPLLAAAVEGEQQLDTWIEEFTAELRTVMLLTGSGTTTALQHQPLVAHGRLRDWLGMWPSTARASL